VKTYIFEYKWSFTQASSAVQEVISALLTSASEMPTLIWPKKCEKLTDGREVSPQKRAKLEKLDFLQSATNTWFQQEFLEKGFILEYPLESKESTANKYLDFAFPLKNNKHILVEIEFGNTASNERNLVKLLDGYHRGISELGVVICPVRKLSKKIGSGIATYEDFKSRLQALHPNTCPAPILVIGLEDDSRVLDLSQSQLGDAKLLSGNHSPALRWSVVKALRAGIPVQNIQPPMPDELRQAKEVLKSYARGRKTPS
jgi:hypothetical protein